MNPQKKTSGIRQSEHVQAHVVYSGMVQGVGFRYTTHRIAVALGLQGWVKNLSDGRVEILVEGKQERIEILLEEIGSHFGSYIREQTVSFQSSNGQFKSFQVIV